MLAGIKMKKINIYISLIFSIISISGFCQQRTFLTNKTIIYTGIFNELRLDCQMNDSANITLIADSLVNLEILKKSHDIYYVRPNFKEWNSQFWSPFPQYNNYKSLISIYLFDEQNQKFLDTIEIVIKKLPEPEVIFNNHGHGGIGSWIEFESIVVKSDLFDELNIDYKVDSFIVDAYKNEDTTYFHKTNVGGSFTSEIKKQIKETPIDFMLRIGPVYINIKGESMIIENKPIFLIIEKGIKMSY